MLVRKVKVEFQVFLNSFSYLNDHGTSNSSFNICIERSSVVNGEFCFSLLEKQFFNLTDDLKDSAGSYYMRCRWDVNKNARRLKLHLSRSRWNDLIY